MVLTGAGGVSVQPAIGAEIMCRNKFGPQRGPWPDHEWKGWLFRPAPGKSAAAGRSLE